jgi:hypothetical protein
MPSYRKARELATKFDREYPETLPDRLAWWCRILGIDRPRFLRMMGLSAAQARKEQNTGWDELLKRKHLEENAWWVEGKLSELLAMFDYDWNALSDRLHHGADAEQEEQSRVQRPDGDIVKLQYGPSNNGADTLLNQIASGGPESFSALISYLAGEHST